MTFKERLTQLCNEDQPDFSPPYTINYTAKEQYLEAIRLLDELGISYTANDPEIPKDEHVILINWNSNDDWVELEIAKILPILSKFELLCFDTGAPDNWSLSTKITTPN